jgi:hypothetical protein
MKSSIALSTIAGAAFAGVVNGSPARPSPPAPAGTAIHIPIVRRSVPQGMDYWAAAAESVRGRYGYSHPSITKRAGNTANIQIINQVRSGQHGV